MQTIILLHGALGEERELSPLKTALSDRGFNALSFSFSGHGFSPFSTNFGIEQFAAELGDFIEKHAPKSPDLFGYSMGGYVALNYALHYGTKIKTIITLGTKFDWSDAVIKKETGLLIPEVLEQKAPAFAQSLAAKHGPSWKELVLKTADLMREINEKQFLTAETLGSIKNKTLVGLADKDQMVSLEETRDAFKALPEAQMYMLPGARHQLESINVKTLSALIVNFINISAE